ncbi:META domain-containing protein [Rhodobacterales bacterium]|nr:META domain-containing protein [Rhodobacterales bacterium]
MNVSKLESCRRACRQLFGVLLMTLALGTTPGAALAAESAPYGPWVAVEVGGKVPEKTISSTLDLSEDGAAQGLAACNRFSGTAEISSEMISFDKLALTRKLCSKPEMDQEQRYLDALSAAASWTVEGGSLILLDKAGTAVARFSSGLTDISFKVALPEGETVERESVVYRCGKFIVDAEYVNAGTISLAVLRMRGETVVASQVMSGSGVRYAGDQYIWWTQGMTEATLQDLRQGQDAPPMTCVAH